MDVGLAEDGGAGGEGVERGSDCVEAAEIAEIIDDGQEHIGPRWQILCIAADRHCGSYFNDVRKMCVFLIP